MPVRIWSGRSRFELNWKRNISERTIHDPTVLPSVRSGLAIDGRSFRCTGPAMTVKVIVNRHVVQANARTGRNDPPLSIKRHKKPTQHGHRVKLKGEPVLIYDPENPLSNGARVWIEAEDAEICV